MEEVTKSQGRKPLLATALAAAAIAFVLAGAAPAWADEQVTPDAPAPATVALADNNSGEQGDNAAQDFIENSDAGESTVAAGADTADDVDAADLQVTDEEQQSGESDLATGDQADAIVLTAAGTGDSSETTHATVYKGIDYAPVYDYVYYQGHYSDVASAYADDDDATLGHFVNFGMKEGRSGSTDFSIASYYNEYADLRSAYGQDWKAYYLHYLNNGLAEGRAATGCTELRNARTSSGGVNWSPVYNAAYYAANNSDVAKSAAIGVGNTVVYDEGKLLSHFVNFGINEGRQASANFNAYNYKYRHADLQSAYLNDIASYYRHYVKNGRAEGRAVAGTDPRSALSTAVINGTTVLNGTNWSAVYNYAYYAAHQADVVSAFQGDPVKMLQQFVNYGMSEKRQASDSFSVDSYYNEYSDLRAAYGKNWKAYYQHFVRNGRAEGRHGTGCDEYRAATYYGGVDWSPVYNMLYYVTKYADLAAAALVKGTTDVYDDGFLIKHFVQNGMNEGRQAKATFNAYNYKYRYADLQTRYKNDLASYYRHYAASGKSEGRAVDGTDPRDDLSTAVVVGTTTMDGTNWAPVYSYAYYIANNADVKSAYKGDPVQTILQFIYHGTWEERQAIASFNAYNYKYRHADLQSAYKNQIASYYLHYATDGAAEGRAVDGSDPRKDYKHAVINGTTVLDGVDWGAVYEYAYYAAHAEDVANAYKGDPVKMIQHFYNSGMSEGRQGNSSFNVYEFRNSNPTARAVFGNDLKEYYRFYIRPWYERNLILTAYDFSSPTGYLIIVDNANCWVGIFEGSYHNWNLRSAWMCTNGADSSKSLMGTYHVNGRGYSFGDDDHTCFYYTVISGNYLFHSILYQPYQSAPRGDNIKEDALGVHWSNGCIRLATDNAYWIYNNIPNGTTIYLSSY